MSEKFAKVLFLGLQNAGKTSILIALKKKFNFQEEVEKLRPTIKVQRSTFKYLSMIISQQDFGGQEKYRQEYLNNKEFLFSGTDLIYYLIDVREQENFDISLKYFEDIAKYFKESNEKIPVMVLFHKYDPEVIQDLEIGKAVMSLKGKLNKWHDYLQIDYFETSIFNLRSIIKAFSYGMSKILPELKKILDERLDLLVSELGLTATFLLDENGLIIGEAFKNNLIDDEREKIQGIFIEVEKNISNREELGDKIAYLLYKMGKSGLHNFFNIGNSKFSLAIVTDDLSTKKTEIVSKKIDAYIELLKDYFK